MDKGLLLKCTVGIFSVVLKAGFYIFSSKKILLWHGPLGVTALSTPARQRWRENSSKAGLNGP